MGRATYTGGTSPAADRPTLDRALFASSWATIASLRGSLGTPAGMAWLNAKPGSYGRSSAAGAATGGGAAKGVTGAGAGAGLAGRRRSLGTSAPRRRTTGAATSRLPRPAPGASPRVRWRRETARTAAARPRKTTRPSTRTTTALAAAVTDRRCRRPRSTGTRDTVMRPGARTPSRQTAQRRAPVAARATPTWSRAWRARPMLRIARRPRESGAAATRTRAETATTAARGTSAAMRERAGTGPDRRRQERPAAARVRTTDPPSATWGVHGAGSARGRASPAAAGPASAPARPSAAAPIAMATTQDRPKLRHVPAGSNRASGALGCRGGRSGPAPLLSDRREGP